MTEIWHNPKCSKSRATLALVLERDPATKQTRYLDAAPSRARIVEVHAMLGGPVVGMMRTGEAVFAELGLTKDASDDALFDAMAAHPRLIERPIVIVGERAKIGRPPESVLALFEG